MHLLGARVRMGTGSGQRRGVSVTSGALRTHASAELAWRFSSFVSRDMPAVCFCLHLSGFSSECFMLLS